MEYLQKWFKVHGVVCSGTHRASARNMRQEYSDKNMILSSVVLITLINSSETMNNSDFFLKVAVWQNYFRTRKKTPLVHL